MAHDKPHEHGVIIRRPDDPNELEGAWLPAATPEQARKLFEAETERLLLAEASAGSSVLVELIIGGERVEAGNIATSVPKKRQAT